MEVGNEFRRLDYVGPGPNIMLFGFLWMQLYNAKVGWSLEAYDAWSRWRET